MGWRGPLLDLPWVEVEAVVVVFVSGEVEARSDCGVEVA